MTAMEKQFSTPNLLVVFYPENSVLAVWFSESCGNLMEVDLKEERKQIERAVAEHKPSYLLADLSACTYYTSGDHIRWYENTLFQRFKNLPVKKIGLVVPHNLFVHATIEAARMSMENPHSVVQYFMSREKAFSWLDSQPS
ncbi:hypothetical protein [Sunxiuqinia dokdonensis]|uniref:STAS/SEC14 domain-containing protein n=1 Tax=Sunxiuqinia dokdonensis TaxID=1409788 RepID=A0A0L8VD80_9BACT|nr:hypothetical protein [Sunxiuqinia dokdonensis]KOH46435.1 hypothetical protein NC99_07460 [Sunxiuqinia dokdonensis]